MSQNLMRGFITLGALTLFLATGISRLVTATGGVVLYQAGPGTTKTTQNDNSKPQQTSPQYKPDKDTIYKDEFRNTITEKEYMRQMATGKYVKSGVVVEGRLAEIWLVTVGDTVNVGARAPEFKGNTLDGKTLSLADLKGKVVVMNFWFIACKPCVEEMPGLNRIVAKHQGNNDVVFIAVTTDKKTALDDFLKKHPFDYPIIPSAEAIFIWFKISLCPTHYVIGRNGVILKRFKGPFDFSTLDSAIETALKSRPG